MASWLDRIAVKLPRNPARERLVLRVSLIVAPLALISAGIGADLPILSLLGTAISMGAWMLVVVYVRRLPRMVISGAIGGGLVGFLVLGIGSRSAMRVIALLGGRREMTLEGTAFLLVAGTMIGAVLGVSIAGALRAWPGARRIIGSAAGLSMFAGLMLDSATFAELLHEGPGGWLNIPMFFTVLMAYGWMAPGRIKAIERRLPRWAPSAVRAVESVGV